MKTIQFRLFFAIIILLFVGCVEAYSQLPYTYWGKQYNGPANLQDSSVALSTNSSGALFVGGWSMGSSTNADIVVIRYNPETGDSMWVYRFAGPLEDKMTAMTCDNNAVYVTGWSFSAATSRDIITIKIDAATGAPLWVRTYNGTNNGGDYGYSVAVDAAGNVYSGGRSDVAGGLGQKYTIVKYDAGGNVPSGWPAVYTGGLSTSNDEIHSVKVDGSGNVFVTGRAGAVGASHYLTLKVNSAGIVQWGKLYIGNSNIDDNAAVIVLDNSAAFAYVGGYSFRVGANQVYAIVKYNTATGDSVGFASYQNQPNNMTDVLTAMTIDASNNVYATGYSIGNGTNFDFATIKFNSNLAQQWVGRTSDGGSDFAYSICVSPTDGAVYVTGSSVGSGTAYDYLTIKYDAGGNEIWRKRENGNTSGNDLASSVAYVSEDHIYVTGSANFNPPGSIVFYTLRYSNFVGIEPISTNMPAGYSLSQNYPNPFNPTTTINFDIPKTSNVRLAVFDAMGREVEVIADQQVHAGQYKATWDASRYSSGIYFYKLAAGDFVQTKKMMLIK